MSRSVRLAAQANCIATLSTASPEDLQKARQLLSDAQEAKPHGTTWLQIGRAYMELGDFEASHKAFDQARQELKKNPALELFCAVLAYDEGDYDKAQAYLDELQKICPENQALPTARAICLLRQERFSEGLKLLHPQGKHKEKFDITVSPILVSRLAAVVEEIVLPCELPPRELVEAAEKPKEAEAEKPAETSEGEDAQPEAPKATTPTQESQPGEITDPKAFADELKPILPPLPEGAKISKLSLQYSGTDRLQRAWDLPQTERLQQFAIAIHELYRTYTESPRAYQSAFCLAEGLLAYAEYGRDRRQPYGEQSLELVRFAERLLREALVRDKDTAFANHYLARTALLQHRYSEAISTWTSALEAFEKLPEAHYGLGQSHMMNGDKRAARLFITQAVNADMHLMRERLADLEHLKGSSSN